MALRDFLFEKALKKQARIDPSLILTPLIIDLSVDFVLLSLVYEFGLKPIIQIISKYYDLMVLASFFIQK